MLFFFHLAHEKPGWWFGTFCIFHNIWEESSSPTDELLFFRGVETTNQIWVNDYPIIVP
jgi:hypothetical protein